MQYLGDYAEDYATLNFKFSTHKADGTPATLSGTPAISVYKANGTTQSTAGITLSVDFDSVTGLNNVLIDLSADAFYAVANDYQVVITTGTVDSVSVVGTVLAHFSIENRFNEVDVTKISGDSTAADNLESACDNYSAARGLAGTALPNAAADAAGGLPISDAGALDLDTLLTRLDAAISTRLASAGYTAPNNSGITDIKAKTDQLSFTSPNKVDATATVSVAGLATESKQDEIISDIAGVITHGDSNWLTPSGIGGTIAITFNVKDDSGDNILDAVVEVWDTAGTTLKERKETNSSGNAIFNCKAETYTIKITKSGYSFDNASYTVTVPATVNYVMTAFVIPVSPDLTKCRVWMKLVNTYTSLTVTAEVPENLAGNNLVMGSYTGVYDTVNNLVYWDIPQGAVNSVLKITELGFEVVVPLIPDLDESEIEDLI